MHFLHPYPRLRGGDDGLVSNAVYDLDGRLTQLQVKDGTTLVSGFGLAYADNLNLTGITDQVTAANSNVLGYTPANRLASASGVWGNKAYSYDGVGNRITDVTTGGASVSRTQYYSNTSNRLNDIWENGAQLRVYTYDGAGNTLTETRPGEAFAYTYNKRNRLASVTRNGSLWGTYVYKAFEQLVSRTSPAPAAPLGTVHYIHDLDGHLIAEADGATGAVLRDYIWLPANDNEVQDLPLAVIDGVNTATPVTSFIHTDHLGRPTRMTNAAKATVWQAVWTPWGEAQSMTGSVTQNLRFPGQYFQIETGLNYNHHRQYDPVTGRYTQPDPLGFVDGPSVYAYAGNSPWINTDREGLESGVVIWEAVGWGASSFGHTSAYVNNTSYSFGPSGMYISDVGKYLQANSFREGKRYSLPLSSVQEVSFEACLKSEGGAYSAFSNSCVDPVKNCLKKVGFRIVGPILTPEDLEIVIRDRAKSIHTLPQSTPSDGISAPWTLAK